MKKTLIGMVLVICVLLGSYVGMGVLSQRAIEKTLQDLHETKSMDLKITEYHRGFFYSDVLLSWHIHTLSPEVSGGDAETAIDAVVPIHLSIAHGPMMLSRTGLHVGLGYAQGQLTLPQKYQEQFKSLLSETSTQPLLKLSLLMTFFNQAIIEMHVPKFHADAKTAVMKLNWKGLTSKLTLSLNLSELTGSFKFNGLSLIRDQLHLLLNSVHSDYQFNKTELGLYEGQAHFSLASLKLLVKDKPAFMLKKFKFETEHVVTQKLFNSQLKTSIDGLDFEGEHYGPGMLTLSLDHLDAEVLARIHQKIQDMRDASIIKRQKNLLVLLPELPRLLAKGASFSVPTFSFTMPQGVIQGNLSLSMPSGNVSNPFQLIYQVNGEGKLRMPASVLTAVMANAIRQKLQQPMTMGMQEVDHIPQGDALEAQVQEMTQKRLASLVSSGALIFQSGAYALDVSLQSGKIVVNGKPFTPAMLAF